ncbi:hypothetical protein HN51_064179 [Arachis hypogaea]
MRHTRGMLCACFVALVLFSLWLLTSADDINQKAASLSAVVSHKSLVPTYHNFFSQNRKFSPRSRRRGPRSSAIRTRISMLQYGFILCTSLLFGPFLNFM